MNGHSVAVTDIETAFITSGKTVHSPVLPSWRRDNPSASAFFTTPVFDSEVIITQRSYPALSRDIKLCCGENVRKRIIISNNLKQTAIEIVVKFLSHRPL